MITINPVDTAGAGATNPNPAPTAETATNLGMASTEAPAQAMPAPASAPGTFRMAGANENATGGLPSEALQSLAAIATRVWDQVAPHEWDRLAEVLPMNLTAIDQTVESFSMQAAEWNNSAADLFEMMDENTVSQAVMGVVFTSVGGAAVHRVLWRGRNRRPADVNDDESITAWLLAMSTTEA